MKFYKTLFFIFIFLNSGVKADLNNNLIKELKQGGKLIFIRHAYAPGNGDPQNFNLYDCSTQRNLSESGRQQSKKIGKLFLKYNIDIKNVYSSEWCRCKETASIAFKEYKTKKFLNSFYSAQFIENKSKQIKEFYNFIDSWDKKKNLLFVTHYVFILEIIKYAPSSGEIIIVDENFKIVDTIDIMY